MLNNTDPHDMFLFIIFYILSDQIKKYKVLYKTQAIKPNRNIILLVRVELQPNIERIHKIKLNIE